MKTTRHIPKGDILQIGAADFGVSLEQALRPRDDYDTGRWLFVPPEYTEYRYLLGTRGLKTLICIGINPSTARPDALDPTLKSVERIALRNGFDSFMMLNVYPQRATMPDDMGRESSLLLRRENCRAFRYALSLSSRPVVWAAWGNLIEKRPYLKDCLRELMREGIAAGAEFVCCGPISKAGHPHHPLYLRKDEPLVPFDAQTYLSSL